MPHCKYCFDPRRDEIDAQFIHAIPLRSIVRSFGGSLGAASRHRQHVRDLLRARSESERTELGGQLGGQLVERCERLIDTTEKILATATSKADLRAATSAVAALTRLLELLGRMTGEIQSANSGGIYLNLTSNRTMIKYGPDDDVELAQLVSEATNNFNPNELARLQRLVATPVENASFTELSCNNLATLPKAR